MSGALVSVLTGGVSELLGPLISRLVNLIPDPVAAAKAAQEAQDKLLEADSAMIAQQNEINKVEASNANLFVSGWRPAVGWVCVAGLAWQNFFVQFFTYWFNAFGYVFSVPAIDSSITTTLLIPLLGLGGLKTFERVKGVSNEGSVQVQQLVPVVPTRTVLDLPSATPTSNLDAMTKVNN